MKVTNNELHTTIRGLVAALAVLLAAGCATGKAARPDPLPVLTIPQPRVTGIDRRTVRLDFTVTLSNPGPAPFELVSDRFRLSLGGMAAGETAREVHTEVGPGQSVAVEVGFTRDVGKLTEPAGGAATADADWQLDVAVDLASREGRSRSVTGQAAGTFPLVREPAVVIESIGIERDVLVNTRLRLLVRIENPNAFEVGLRSVAYDFYGEGKEWATGEVGEKAVTVPARGSVEVELPVTMNFIEMGRNLLDLVAKLRTVRYRLAGNAIVSTPLAFLPEFRMAFDQSGSTLVRQ